MSSRSLREHFPSAAFVAAFVGILLLGAAAFVYFGIYNVAADDPHTRLVYSLLDELRDRSIEVRAKNIAVPQDLSSPERIARGAGLYQEMCVSCHLGPGVEPSELSQGLYPQAPKLAENSDHTPGELFWIIKHGVKLSAMPAWGKTHPDPLIWDMVAFVGKLPQMSAEQFKATVDAAPADHDEMMDMGAGHHDDAHAEPGADSPSGAAAHHHDEEGAAPHTH